MYYAKVAEKGAECDYLIDPGLPETPMPIRSQPAGTTIRMLSATYVVVVRETRTARAVASFRLSSADAYTANDTDRDDPPGCPDIVDGSDLGTDQILPPLTKSFVHQLRPLVRK